MQGKGCRVCLGGTICSIPCHASWFASVYLEGTVEFSRSAWKKRFNSTVSFKSTETKQLARQGIEQILPRKQTRRPLTCLTVCFNPPSMAYPKGCRYSSRALTKMLVQRFIWMKFLTCNLTKVLERKNSTSLTENNDTWCKNVFFYDLLFFLFSKCICKIQIQIHCFCKWCFVVTLTFKNLDRYKVLLLFPPHKTTSVQ